MVKQFYFWQFDLTEVIFLQTVEMSLAQSTGAVEYTDCFSAEG